MDSENETESDVVKIIPEVIKEEKKLSQITDFFPFFFDSRKFLVCSV